jgi:hypothetical protein
VPTATRRFARHVPNCGTGRVLASMGLPLGPVTTALELDYFLNGPLFESDSHDGLRAGRGHNRKKATRRPHGPHLPEMLETSRKASRRHASALDAPMPRPKRK